LWLLVLAVIFAGCGGTEPSNAVPTVTAVPTDTATALPTRTSPPTLTPTIAATATPIDSNLAAAANAGGCYPLGTTGALFDMLTLVNPEWVPLTNGMTVDSDPVLIHGMAVLVHGDLGGDFPATHVRSDQNTIMRLDDEDAGRLATGNFGGGDENGLLGLEWEAGAYPAWAWAGEDDRVVALGRWIFDCGHPNAANGHCSLTASQECLIAADCKRSVCPTCSVGETCEGAQFGYSSELHPPQATAVLRSGRGALVSTAPEAHAVGATLADVYVSSDGGGAGDRCILTHHLNPMEQLTAQCFPLSQPVARINERDFVFDLPLPQPQPTGTHATYRIIDRPLPGGNPAAVDVSSLRTDPSPHFEVRVRTTQATANGLPTGYAARIIAGWENDPTSYTHVRVSITAAVIRNALQRATPVVPRLCVGAQTPCVATADCPSDDTCSGVGTVKTWRLQSAVNGEFTELSGLSSVSTDEVIAQTIVSDQYLPADGSLRVFANGIAEECIQTMFNKPLHTDIQELGLANGLSCLTSTPHPAGVVDVSYPGPDFGAPTGAMDYETVSTGGEGGACSASLAQLCVVDADCPSDERCVASGGAFALRYRIERLS
jgi:hypothetical protein